MDKDFYNMTILLDFYGNLLTDKQKEIMSYHYESDMSLSEISEEAGISRQAVYDIINRSEKQLKLYESKLKLAEKFKLKKIKIDELKNLIKSNDFSLIEAAKLLDELLQI